MEKEIFNKAYRIDQLIIRTKAQQAGVKDYKQRPDDPEFNKLREIAYEALSFKIGVYQSDFKKL